MTRFHWGLRRSTWIQEVLLNPGSLPDADREITALGCGAALLYQRVFRSDRQYSTSVCQEIRNTKAASISIANII
jgi:hypothetical protein